MSSRPPNAIDLPIRPRYPEVDRMGVVHHCHYLVYFEMGRTELLRATGLSYAQLEQQGVFFVVSRLACQFKAPARYDELLTLRTRTTRLSRARIDHEYLLKRTDDGQLISEAQSTIACVDRQGRVQPIPDWVYRQIAPAED